MSFDTRGGGVTKLSQLEIDADKDWGLYGLHNLAYVADAMQTGDSVQHNGGILTRLPPTDIGDELMSQGHLQDVKYQAPPSQNEIY